MPGDATASVRQDSRIVQRPQKLALAVLSPFAGAALLIPDELAKSLAEPIHVWEVSDLMIRIWEGQ